MYINQFLTNFEQGFTKFHFTPLEVLAVIQHIEKRLDRTFSPEEIENGVLKDLITEEDYNMVKVVSTHSKNPQ